MTAVEIDQKSVQFESSDGVVFNVAREVAMASVTIKNMLEDIGDTETMIPLPNITSPTLTKVIAFLNHHHEHPDPIMDEKEQKKIDNITPWDKEFCDVDQATLFELIMFTDVRVQAANYLDIKILLDVTCKTIASMIRGKTPEEIRKTFNIKNDFTPEEEEALKKENEWVEDK